MTMEEDREREVSELSEPSEAPATPHVKVTKVKAQRLPSEQAHVTRKAEVVVLAEARMVPCDRCQAKGHKCHSRTKGGQPLNVCIGCHGQKLLCRMGEAG